MNEKHPLRILGAVVKEVILSVVSTAIVGKIAEYLPQLWLRELLQRSGIMIFLFLCIFIAMDIYLYVSRSVSYNRAVELIKGVNRKYVTSDAVEIFQLSAENEGIHDENREYRGGLFRKFNDKKPATVYYALSAKEYLNWIDYLYFDYLRQVQKLLKHKIIIYLHVPDSVRLCRVEKTKRNPVYFSDHHRETVKQFKQYIRAILGTNVKIREEEKLFCTAKQYRDFQLIYDSGLLYYADQMSQEKIDFKMFKRRLSHLRSVLPIWRIAGRRGMGYRQTFVLDNAMSVSAWREEPLKTIRHVRNIYFIEVGDIKDGYGKRIDVHEEKNTINLTDSMEVIQEKVYQTDSKMKKDMIYLLGGERYQYQEQMKLSDDDDALNKLLITILKEMKEKYGISKADEGRNV